MARQARGKWLLAIAANDDWWDILSGDEYGKPCVREGIEFPVLRVAQVCQGKPVTANAIARGKSELSPDVALLTLVKSDSPDSLKQR
jgi:hypothetical protein